MPKIRVVRATTRELQQSMNARDYVPDYKRPLENRRAKEPEVLKRYPLRHLRAEGAES